MTRIIAALALLALSCASPDGYLPTSDPLYDEVDVLATRWAVRDDLPDIWTPQCARWLRDARIRIATDEQWTNPNRSAELTFDDATPVIFLAPFPTADGYEAGVRHETAHLLALCTDMGSDVFGHATPAIWGADGVVWRDL